LVPRADDPIVPSCQIVIAPLQQATDCDPLRLTTGIDHLLHRMHHGRITTLKPEEVLMLTETPAHLLVSALRGHPARPKPGTAATSAQGAQLGCLRARRQGELRGARSHPGSPQDEDFHDLIAERYERSAVIVISTNYGVNITLDLKLGQYHRWLSNPCSTTYCRSLEFTND